MLPEERLKSRCPKIARNASETIIFFTKHILHGHIFNHSDLITTIKTTTACESRR